MHFYQLCVPLHKNQAKDKNVMTITEQIFSDLQQYINMEKREILPRFFKTGKGEYGEGDRFMGIVVPDIRKVAKAHKEASISDIEVLLASEYHEMRLCGLLIMVLRWKKATETERRTMFDFYLAHTACINNWDLVDLSAPAIVGGYLMDKPRDILYRLAESRLLWDNRIAIVSTFAFIKKADLDDTYALADKMMHHPHDLMHKAIGWMLREAGKRDARRLYEYVEEHRTVMPRTMLRYAIEKFSETERKHLMRREAR